ncbi:hypothetical protein BROUX41_000062 [Berkeleyomyces rouxiae]|uniref:uncharacterized protein n=1 Tax=Berkeleyomyces rouxiae TaxID=2035830 RepID=UPI003B7A25D1
MSSKRTWSAYDHESSEAPFAVYGSPIPSSQNDRGAFVPLHLQEARDDKGRRRFHGAFTGGWSAGYFNTVGSKEGWKPSTFVSSRTNRSGAIGDQTKGHLQKPEDFMDEEDVADAQASAQLHMVDAPQSSVLLGKGSESLSPLELMLLGQAPRETTGHRLLQKMGWKPGQGIGPKVLRTARLHLGGSTALSDSKDSTLGQEHLFAPDDIDVATANRKSTRHGLGYLNNDSGTHQGLLGLTVQDRDDETQPIKGRIRMSKSSSSSRQKEKVAPLVGVSLGEDDEDYDETDLGPRINYSKTKLANDAKKAKRKPTSNLSNKSTLKRNPVALGQRVSCTLPGGFVSALRSATVVEEQSSRDYDPPVVPSGWTPMVSALENGSSARSVQPTTALQMPQYRGAVLGEKQLLGQSIFDFITPEARARLAIVSGKSDLPAAGGKAIPTNDDAPVSVGDVYASSPSLDRESALAALTRANTLGGPYHNDEAKKKRYTLYLKVQAKQVDVTDISPDLSLAELRLELAEFYNCARIFRPMTGFMASRFAPSSRSPGDKDSDTRPAVKHEDAAIEAAKLGMYGALTRSIQGFSPVRLLYKRFNIVAPSHTVVPPESESGPARDSDATVDLSHEAKQEMGAMNDGQPGQQHGRAAEVASRPPEDVFRSIFGEEEE